MENRNARAAASPTCPSRTAPTAAIVISRPTPSRPRISAARPARTSRHRPAGTGPARRRDGGARGARPLQDVAGQQEHAGGEGEEQTVHCTAPGPQHRGTSQSLVRAGGPVVDRQHRLDQDADGARQVRVGDLVPGLPALRGRDDDPAAAQARQVVRDVRPRQVQVAGKPRRVAGSSRRRAESGSGSGRPSPGPAGSSRRAARQGSACADHTVHADLSVLAASAQTRPARPSARPSTAHTPSVRSTDQRTTNSSSAPGRRCRARRAGAWRGRGRSRFSGPAVQVLEVGEQGVRGEVQREVRDDADHRRGDRRRARRTGSGCPGAARRRARRGR